MKTAIMFENNYTLTIVFYGIGKITIDKNGYYTEGDIGLASSKSEAGDEVALAVRGEYPRNFLVDKSSDGRLYVRVIADDTDVWRDNCLVKIIDFGKVYLYKTLHPKLNYRCDQDGRVAPVATEGIIEDEEEDN